jgi:hypothetical protein
VAQPVFFANACWLLGLDRRCGTYECTEGANAEYAAYNF